MGSSPMIGNSPGAVVSCGPMHVGTVKVELGDKFLVLVCVLILVIAGCALIMGRNLARQAEMEEKYDDLRRQYRMTELKLDDWTVVAHRAGIQLSGDYTRGPQGNPEAEAYHIQVAKKGDDHGRRRDN